jgi:ATP-dependent DNA helicase RecG
VDDKGGIERKDVEAMLGLSQTPSGRLLKKMTDRGILMKRGNGKNTIYTKPSGLKG